MRDITYCARDCANYKCERNKEHLEPAQRKCVWFEAFEACKEFIGKGEYNDK